MLFMKVGKKQIYWLKILKQGLRWIDYSKTLIEQISRDRQI